MDKLIDFSALSNALNGILKRLDDHGNQLNGMRNFKDTVAASEKRTQLQFSKLTERIEEVAANPFSNGNPFEKDFDDMRDRIKRIGSDAREKYEETKHSIEKLKMEVAENKTLTAEQFIKARDEASQLDEDLRERIGAVKLKIEENLSASGQRLDVITSQMAKLPSEDDISANAEKMDNMTTNFDMISLQVKAMKVQSTQSQTKFLQYDQWMKDNAVTQTRLTKRITSVEDQLKKAINSIQAKIKKAIASSQRAKSDIDGDIGEDDADEEEEEKEEEKKKDDAGGEVVDDEEDEKHDDRGNTSSSFQMGGSSGSSINAEALDAKMKEMGDRLRENILGEIQTNIDTLQQRMQDEEAKHKMNTKKFFMFLKEVEGRMMDLEHTRKTIAFSLSGKLRFEQLKYEDLIARQKIGALEEGEEAILNELIERRNNGDFGDDDISATASRAKTAETDRKNRGKSRGQENEYDKAKVMTTYDEQPPLSSDLPVPYTLNKSDYFPNLAGKPFTVSKDGHVSSQHEAIDSSRLRYYLHTSVRSMEGKLKNFSNRLWEDDEEVERRIDKSIKQSKEYADEQLQKLRTDHLNRIETEKATRREVKDTMKAFKKDICALIEDSRVSVLQTVLGPSMAKVVKPPATAAGNYLNSSSSSLDFDGDGARHGKDAVSARRSPPKTRHSKTRGERPQTGVFASGMVVHKGVGLEVQGSDGKWYKGRDGGAVLFSPLSSVPSDTQKSFTSSMSATPPPQVIPENESVHTTRGTAGGIPYVLFRDSSAASIIQQSHSQASLAGPPGSAVHAEIGTPPTSNVLNPPTPYANMKTHGGSISASPSYTALHHNLPVPIGMLLQHSQSSSSIMPPPPSPTPALLSSASIASIAYQKRSTEFTMAASHSGVFGLHAPHADVMKSPLLGNAFFIQQAMLNPAYANAEGQLQQQQQQHQSQQALPPDSTLDSKIPELSPPPSVAVKRNAAGGVGMITGMSFTGSRPPTSREKNNQRKR